MIATATVVLLAATIAFCAADRMFLQRPPLLADFDRTHRVYVHGQSFFGEKRFLPSLTYRQFSAIRERARGFDAVVATSDVELLAGPAESPRWAHATLATGQFWSLFTARPGLGRFFSASEEATPVTVISNRVWQSQFNGDSSVIGREVRVGAASFRVIGVMPRGLVGLHAPPADYVVPLQAGLRAITARSVDPSEMHGQWLAVVARRAPGVSRATATTQLSRLLGDAGTNAPDERTMQVLLAPIQPARGPTMNDEPRIAQWMSLLAALLLISAVANLASVQGTRIARRQRELAIRTALGMTRVRLVRMVLVDTVLQLVAAAVVASIVTSLFGAIAIELAFPGLPWFRSDETMRLVLFILTTGLSVGIAAGVGASLHAIAINATEGLNGGGSNRPRRSLMHGRAAMAIQGGAALVLTVCATLFLSSLREASTVQLGYDANRLVWITSQPRHSASRSELREELARVSDALAVDPDVDRVALADRAPRMAYMRTNVFLGSSELPVSGELDYHRVGRGYFDVMGMQFEEGHSFRAADSPPSEIVVSLQMAKQLAPRGSALGMCLRLTSAEAPCRTVVGVVNDVRDMRLDRTTSAEYYVLSTRDEDWQSGLIVRAKSTEQVHAIQRTAARLSTTSFGVESYAVSTLVAEGRRGWRAGAIVFSLLAGAAILLSIVGLSSSIAEDASRRSHEFAIRSAVGAGPMQLATLVAREGIETLGRMVCVGGPAVAVVIVNVRPLLFTATTTLAPALSACALVATVTLLALSLPAIHLCHVDVARVLRATI